MSTWTKTPPTKPGVYMFLPKWGKPEAVLLHKNNHDGLLYQDGQNYSADSWDGEWQGPFVPVEEVEKAWHEAAAGGPGYLWARYRHSRARKIVEGELV